MAGDQTWKRRAGIPAGAIKGVSVATCKRLLPDAAAHLTRIKDGDRAEALLLTLQVRAAFTNQPKGT